MQPKQETKQTDLAIYSPIIENNPKTKFAHKLLLGPCSRDLKTHIQIHLPLVFCINPLAGHLPNVSRKMLPSNLPNRIG